MSVGRLPQLIAACLAAWLIAWAGPAEAGPRQDVQKRLSAAMESYDLLEYETAKKLLISALEIARDGRLEADPLIARVHLSLGIVHFAGFQDKAAARRSFIDAVTIDPQIALDPAYKTPDMSTLLETVRAATAPSRPPPDRNAGGQGGTTGTGGVAGTGGTTGTASGGEDCFTISGLRHRLVDRARRGAPQRITASLGGDVQAAKVSVFVRGLRKPEFLELELTRDRDCTYTGTIPGNLLTGDTVHYYIAAVNAKGTTVASSGAPGAPNLVELFGSESATAGELEENPLVADPSPAEPQASAFQRAPARQPPAPSGRKLFVAVGAATGLGYVTGETEQQRNEVQCCIAPGLFTLVGEVGYALSPRLLVSGVVRLGFPIGANIDGHSPMGPAGFLRARYALSASAPSPSSGLSLSGQLGGGIIRNTVELSEGAAPGMDVDVVALGPVLAGVGLGYGLALMPALSLQFDLTAIAGIPVVGELGTSKLNFGVQVDATASAVLHF